MGSSEPTALFGRWSMGSRWDSWEFILIGHLWWEIRFLDDIFLVFALNHTGRGVKNAGMLGEGFGDEATGVLNLRHFVVVQFRTMPIVQSYVCIKWRFHLTTPLREMLVKRRLRRSIVTFSSWPGMAEILFLNPGSPTVGCPMMRN